MEGTAAGAGVDERRTALSDALWWTVAALLVAHFPIQVTTDWFSSRLLALPVFLYAALLGAWGPFSRSTRARWYLAAGVAVVAAGLGVVPDPSDPVAVGASLATGVLLAATAVALAGSTRELELAVSRQWRGVAALALAAAAVGGAAAAYALRVGTAHDPLDGGAFTDIGGRTLSLPGSAWPIVLSGSVPFLAAVAWSVVAFVLTWRSVRQHPTDTPAEPPRGAPVV